MKVVISPRAEKQLRRIHKIRQIFVANKIRALGGDEIVGEEKLSGHKDIYRVRVGDYRIVYRKTRGEIYLVLIGHRREIYDLLRRLMG